MKIKVKNLGVLKQAEFELGDFTIICGENNTGKTYATYALFGFLSTCINEMHENEIKIEVESGKIQQLLTEGVTRIDINHYVKNYQGILDQINQLYTQKLSNIFATAKEKFKESSFEFILTSQDLKNFNSNQVKKYLLDRLSEHLKFDFFGNELESEENISLVITLLKGAKDTHFLNTFNNYNDCISWILGILPFLPFLRRPFIISPERTGAATFRKQLNFAHSKLLEQMSRADASVNLRGLLSNAYEDYSLPIKTNLDFLENLGNIAKQSSFITENHPDILDSFSDLIGGKYTINDNDQLYYQPKGQKLRLTMDESSSAVRSLLDLGFYLRHVAQRGDLLIIDEPELNLHPENQRRVARLLARLVNLGIKVFITTHSDYIVKELNTLIMLNHDKSHLKRIAEVEGYQQSELLKAEQIRVYIAEEAPVLLDGKKRKTKCQTLTPANIDPEMGIEARSFDKTIETMNRIQEDIVWGAD